MTRIGLWSLLLLSCISDEAQSIQISPIQMFSRMINEIVDNNVIICPPAIDLALSQLYVASAGETEAELQKVLNYTGAAKEGIFDKRFQSMTKWENPHIRIASRLYLNKGIKIKPKAAFTESETMEFSAKAAAKINQWVISKTDRGLGDLIDPAIFEETKKIFLVNAVSFSGLWKYKFKPIANTSFYIPDESRSATVKMMQVVATLKYNYEHNIDCHVVFIPYAHSEISMVLLIPRSSYGIEKIEESLKIIDVHRAVLKNVRLSMPEFKFRYSVDVVQALIDLGVSKDVFAKANLSGLLSSKEVFSIDSIHHSSFIKVGEEGSKTAFATGNNMIFGRTPIGPKYVDIVVNRPFLFAITDSTRMYFFGRFSHPEI